MNGSCLLKPAPAAAQNKLTIKPLFCCSVIDICSKFAHFLRPHLSAALVARFSPAQELPMTSIKVSSQPRVAT
jgi:hypothetical protein